VNATLAVIEDIIASSGIGGAIETLLPTAVRSRQLTASTLLAGMMLALADGRPAHLTRAHTALLALPADDQKRLGVIAGWKDGPHQLTCRQVEHTARLIKNALAKQQPDGAASADLQQSCDRLLEASIPAEFKSASSSLAVDWTDVEAWSRPVPHEAAGSSADPEARWGHRNVNLKIQKGQMFFGYYLPAATMVKDEDRPAVPELVRRITVCNTPTTPPPPWSRSCKAWPRPGDILADSGFSHRQPGTWAVPLRSLRASLVVDLHPPGNPRRRHHLQRQPLLPRHPEDAAGTDPATARRRTPRHRRPRPADS
jgi:hypothetical protein